MFYQQQAEQLRKQEEVINHELGVIRRKITCLNRKAVYAHDEAMRMMELKEREAMFERMKANSRQLVMAI